MFLSSLFAIMLIAGVAVLGLAALAALVLLLGRSRADRRDAVAS